MNRALKYFFLLLIFISSCAPKKSPEELKQLTRFRIYKGELKVDADAGLQSIMKQQKEVFDFYNDSVQTNISYKAEKEMFEDFKSKKATLLLLTRELDKKEVSDLEKFDTIYIRQLAVAFDAVALIGGNDFDDKGLDLDVLKKYFAPDNSSATNPKLVFENQNSSTVSFVLGKLGYQGKVSANVYALQTAEEVIEYVSKNKNTIGFVPFNLLSDEDDGRVKKILQRVKILSLRAKNKEGIEVRVSANQSDIADGSYPLIRTVNTVTRNTYADNLELLLVNFLSKEKGARIFLKSGLIPVVVPERQIIVNESKLKASQ